ncbi:hypothetical protein CGI92_21980 [Vibrio parahaemolyticus]|nr:hypothetical protein CGI92_21980 [Vibrio parahaemolyticus]
MRSRHFNDLGETARLRNRRFLYASYLRPKAQLELPCSCFSNTGRNLPTNGTVEADLFQSQVTEACWRTAITQLLSTYYSELDLSVADCPFIRHEKDWFAFLRSQYRRRWKLHFGKKTDQQHKTVNYLGRYLKRPPISGSRLHHYSKRRSADV